MRIEIITIIAAVALTGCGRMMPSVSPPAAPSNTAVSASHNTISLNLSDKTDKRVDLVSVEGEFDQNAYLINSENVMHAGVVGRFGCPVEIMSAKFTSGHIRFKYRPLEMNGVPPENLIVLHYNEETSFYDTVFSMLEKDKNTVSADITEAGVYMLADRYEWEAAWGMDTSSYSHPLEYKDDEFNFVFTAPEGLNIEYLSDYLKDDEDGQYKVLLRSAYNEKLKLGVEYLLRPDSESAEKYLNTLADAAAQNGTMKERGTLTAKSGTRGRYFFVDFGDTDLGRAYSVNCMYEYSPTEYINFWYGFSDEAVFEEVKTSLESFGFLGK